MKNETKCKKARVHVGQSPHMKTREVPATIDPVTDEGEVANPVTDEESALACHQGRYGTLKVPIANFATTINPVTDEGKQPTR